MRQTSGAQKQKPVVFAYAAEHCFCYHHATPLSCSMMIVKVVLVILIIFIWLSAQTESRIYIHWHTVFNIKGQICELTLREFGKREGLFFSLICPPDEATKP